MKKKGVSPIIATVLLIGMVVALALIIFVWIRSFTRETVTKFEDENIELACNKVDIQASYSAGDLSISNIGNVPIFNMRVRLITPGGYITKSLKDLEIGWPNVGLNPGDTFLGTIGSAEEIIVIPVLLGNSDKGKRTFACENQEYLVL
jgi:flagellin-like protein